MEHKHNIAETLRSGRQTQADCVLPGLTLPAAAADLPKERPVAQAVQPLLPDQLQELWLQALLQLTGGTDVQMGRKNREMRSQNCRWVG